MQPSRRSFALLLGLALVACASACGSMKNPASVADRFVDRYYVEADQQSALPLADGLAALRLRQELHLANEGRAGAEAWAMKARVYYDRKAFAGEGPARSADYALRIRPEGGGEIERDVHLELGQQADGSWAVTRFSETQGR